MLSDEIHFVPVKNIHVGVAARDTMQSIAKDLGADLKLFYTQCKDFLQDCVRQIQTSFSGMNHFDFLSCLSLKWLRILEFRPFHRLLRGSLAYTIDVVDVQNLDLEWRKKPLCMYQCARYSKKRRVL